MRLDQEKKMSGNYSQDLSSDDENDSLDDNLVLQTNMSISNNSGALNFKKNTARTFSRYEGGGIGPSRFSNYPESSKSNINEDNEESEDNEDNENMWYNQPYNKQLSTYSNRLNTHRRFLKIGEKLNFKNKFLEQKIRPPRLQSPKKPSDTFTTSEA